MLHLQIDGHIVKGVDSGIALDELLQAGFDPDILVLDLNLPLEDGNSIAERIRKAFPHIGIIMHTVRVSTSEKVQGYCSGADMYVAKPASPLEISAAITSLGRRLHPAPPPEWVLDVKNQQLNAPGRPAISLLFADVLTLNQLALAPQGLVESTHLLDILKSVYPHWDKTNLEVHLSRLRKKIAPVSGKAPSIKMLRGVGYQLCLPLIIKN